MEFTLSYDIDHLMILGAGASVEYGLPTWKDLEGKIVDVIQSDSKGEYRHKTQIQKWIEKVGDGKQYATLDECIYRESDSQDHTDDGVEVEDEIFAIMKQIFIDSYTENPDGWIQKMNSKLLANKNLAQAVAVINYNYDQVLDENLLHYGSLTAKSRLRHKSRILDLYRTAISTFCPHGTFFSQKELKGQSSLKKHVKTMKSGEDVLLDAISCFDSEDHTLASSFSHSRALYILGLGGGLEINLKKLHFDIPVSTVHVTIHDEKNREHVVKFLEEKFDNLQPEEIKTYASCAELVELCF